MHLATINPKSVPGLKQPRLLIVSPGSTSMRLALGSLRVPKLSNLHAGLGHVRSLFPPPGVAHCYSGSNSEGSHGRSTPSTETTSKQHAAAEGPESNLREWERQVSDTAYNSQQQLSSSKQVASPGNNSEQQQRADSNLGEWERQVRDQAYNQQAGQQLSSSKQVASPSNHGEQQRTCGLQTSQQTGDAEWEQGWEQGTAQKGPHRGGYGGMTDGAEDTGPGTGASGSGPQSTPAPPGTAPTGDPSKGREGVPSDEGPTGPGAARAPPRSGTGSEGVPKGGAEQGRGYGGTSDTEPTSSGITGGNTGVKASGIQGGYGGHTDKAEDPASFRVAAGLVGVPAASVGAGPVAPPPVPSEGHSAAEYGAPETVPHLLTMTLDASDDAPVPHVPLGLVERAQMAAQQQGAEGGVHDAQAQAPGISADGGQEAYHLKAAQQHAQELGKQLSVAALQARQAAEAAAVEARKAAESAVDEARIAAEKAVRDLPETAEHLAQAAQEAAQKLPSQAAQAAHDFIAPDLGPQAQRHNIREALRDVHRQVLYFLGFGGVIMAGLWVWAAGAPLRRDKPYTFTIAFPMAEGLRPGVPVKLKGVTVGAVKAASVDLHQAYAECEIFLHHTRIPKGPMTRFDFNRQGAMSPECSIDIHTAALPDEAKLELQQQQLPIPIPQIELPLGEQPQPPAPLPPIATGSDAEIVAGGAAVPPLLVEEAQALAVQEGEVSQQVEGPGTAEGAEGAAAGASVVKAEAPSMRKIVTNAVRHSREMQAVREHARMTGKPVPEVGGGLTEAGTDGATTAARGPTPAGAPAQAPAAPAASLSQSEGLSSPSEQAPSEGALSRSSSATSNQGAAAPGQWRASRDAAAGEGASSSTSQQLEPLWAAVADVQQLMHQMKDAMSTAYTAFAGETKRLVESTVGDKVKSGAKPAARPQPVREVPARGAPHWRPREVKAADGGSDVRAPQGQARYTLKQLQGCASPSQVDRCQEQGILVCENDVVQGSLGSSMDELNRMFVKSNRGKGKVQGILGVHHPVTSTSTTPPTSSAAH